MLMSRAVPGSAPICAVVSLIQIDIIEEGNTGNVLNTGEVINPGKPSPADPLGQRGYVGWKMYFAALLLTESWMSRVEVGVTDLT